MVEIERVYEIIKILLQGKKYFTYEELAERLEVSTRTIRSDIEKADDLLGKYGVSIERDRKKGVGIGQTISDENYALITRTLKSADYFTSHERQGLIIGAFLVEKKDLTINFMIELTKSSRTTILKDLPEVEHWFQERNIQVQKIPYVGMKIVYRERDFRSAVLDYLAVFSQKMDSLLLQRGLLKEDILFQTLSEDVHRYYTYSEGKEVFQSFIQNYEQREKVRFTNESYVNIFLYLNIMTKRILKGYQTDFHMEDNVLDSLKITEDIACYKTWLSENVPDIEFPKAEIRELLLYILAQKKIYFELDNSFVNERKLAFQYISAIQTGLEINLLDDKELFDSLLFHIVPTVHRLLYKIKVDNPIKDEIIQQFPEIYRVSKQAVSILEEALGCEVNDDEISLLTLHTAAAVERMKQQTRASNMKRAILVCFSGIGTSNMLLARLNTEFPSLLVKKVLTIDELNQVNMDDYDVVISTVKISFNNTKEFVYVDPLLKERDIKKIEKVLFHSAVKDNTPNKEYLTDELLKIIAGECSDTDLKNLREKLEVFFDEKVYGEPPKKKGIEMYLKEEAIELKKSAADKKEAVRCAGNILLNLGLIEERYIDRMLEVAESSSEYWVIDKGIALVHARPKDGAIKSGLSFVTLEEEIDFGVVENKPVKLIIGLAADGSADHIEALNDISTILYKEDAVNRWYMQTSKEEFIRFALDNRA